jgi:predicted Zn finger-like uncharacterized protein
MLEHIPAEIQCPKCHLAGEVTLDQIRRNATVKCNRCRREIHLRNGAPALRGLNEQLKLLVKHGARIGKPTGPRSPPFREVHRPHHHHGGGPFG